MMKLPDVFTSYDQTKEWITQQLNSLQVCQQEVLTCQEVNTQMTMLFLIVYINNIRSNVFEVSFSMSVALAWNKIARGALISWYYGVVPESIWYSTECQCTHTTCVCVHCVVCCQLFTIVGCEYQESCDMPLRLNGEVHLLPIQLAPLWCAFLSPWGSCTIVSYLNEKMVWNCL